VYRYPWAVKNRAAAGPDGHGANGSKPFGLTAYGEGAVHLLCLRDEMLYPLTFFAYDVTQQVARNRGTQ
jgi:hypothetical protein